MDNTRILVTGAAGFTGRHACKYFAELGFEVVAVVRSPGIFEEGGNIHEHVCDLSQAAQIEGLLRSERPDFMLHLAGLNAVPGSWKEPTVYMNVNVMSTLYILDSLVRHQLTACRVLVVGSMLNFQLSDNAPPCPPHPYSLSKTLQVLSARAWGSLFGLQVLTTLPSNLIGPGRSNGLCGLIAAHAVRQKRELDRSPFRLSSISEARDFLDVRDAVRAYDFILRYGTPGEIYPVGSGRMRTLGEMAAHFESIADIPLSWCIGTQEDAKSISLLPQLGTDGFIPSPVNLESMHRLGWRSVIGLEKSIADTLQFFSET